MPQLPTSELFDVDIPIHCTTGQGDAMPSTSNVTLPESDSKLETDNLPTLQSDVTGIMILLLALQLKHNLSDVAMEDILMLIHSVGAEDFKLPKASKYMFRKTFSSDTNCVNIYHICPECGCNVGIHQDESFTCEYCSTPICTAKNQSNGNVFIYLPLVAQLRAILEDSKLNKHIFDFKKEILSKPPSKSTLTDIVDGKIYQDRLKDSSHVLADVNNLSLSFNCDGIPIFKSSKLSAWPVLCTVNELRPFLRRKHVLIAALHIGSVKPKMNEYLRAFVNECQFLYENGIEYHIDGKAKVSKVAIIVGICDSVARPLLQSFNQFNGKFGCAYCLHPGERVKKGKGNVNAYPSKCKYTERTMAQTLEFADEVLKSNPRKANVHEVEGVSILASIPGFDMIYGMTPDYTHCAILGITRQFLKLWTNSQQHAQAYYIGLKCKEIDMRFLCIKPPASVSRVPRSINELKFWKAHELYHWALFYSLFVLQENLPGKYLKHRAMFSESLYLLLKKRNFK